MSRGRVFRSRARRPAGERDGRDDAVNVQVNDPALDHVVTFDPKLIVTRPFELAVVSETSAVKDGSHVVVGYNSPAATEVQFFPGFGLVFARMQVSAFSTSHDGGRTWASGFVPPVSDRPEQLNLDNSRRHTSKCCPHRLVEEAPSAGLGVWWVEQARASQVLP